MEICSLDKCFGCSLCSDSCPVGAITMTDTSGFYKPQIDASKCISCGLCRKVCISPQNTVIDLAKINAKTPCFAIYSKDDAIHYEAASGGFCTELSREIINQGGVVVGAWWNPKLQIVEHRICQSIEEVELIKKSKYVQSKMEGIYKNVRKIIREKKCLFIGVPCQVFALKRYIHSNHDNLFCIDLLCRGGASSKCLTEHLKNIYTGKASLITFRGGDDDCNFIVYNEKHKKIYRGPQFIDPYFNYFMEHVLYQENCYSCPFAGKQRVGDLTVGDFWGLADESMPKSGGTGINMVLQNTEKGKELLLAIKNKTIIIPREASEAIAGNETLQCPTPMPSEYHELWRSIHEKGFKRGLSYYSANEYKERLERCKYLWKKIVIKKFLQENLPKAFVKKLFRK